MSESATSPPLKCFLDRHGIADYDGLVERAAKEPEWFWAAVMVPSRGVWKFGGGVISG